MDSKDKVLELPDYNESQAKAQPEVQPEAQPQEQLTRLQRWLPYDSKLTFLEFVVFLLCVLFPISFIVFISGAQTFVLDGILKQHDNLGYYTSILGVADQLVSMVMVVVWGIVSDKLGRKIVFTVGFILTGLSIICFPYVKNITTHLVLVRMFFGFGSSAPLAMLTASLSDVRGVRHGGKLTGLVGLISGCGALLGSMGWLKLLATLPKNNQNELPFIIVGVIAIVWGIIVFFFYQSPKVNGIIHDVAPLTDIKTHTIRFWKALKLGFKRPLVGLGYIGGFVARGDTLILSTFVILWVAAFFRKYGLCDDVDKDMLKTTCPGAFGFGHALTGIGQTCAIVGAPFFGVALDYIPNQYVLVISSILAFVGYFGLASNEIPFLKSNFAYASMIGLTEIGTIVCSMKALSDAENVDKTERGNISGVYSLFGSIGILVSTAVGGYIFDNHGGTSPLYLVGGFHVFLAVCAVIICIHDMIVRITKWRRARASSN